MQRPNAREFLQVVLQGIDDLPEGLAQRLLEAVEASLGDRAETLRRLFEDHARG